MARIVADVLFPPVCLGCRAPVGREGGLCPACWRSLRFIERPFCEVLGAPFAHDFGAGIVSADAIANPPPFSRCRSAVVYSGVARRLAQALKYRDATDLAPWLAAWMVRAGTELIDDADLIAPLPLHRWRFFERRFNQSPELARAVARPTRGGFDPSVLTRKKPPP
ncbi:MAG TPA: double zinc ribbon domain-containing protein, partial [Rhizobiaceae bacterium]|nr:double zinc ribbon domain-containing protein [Rhizobiaceae bacterium]